MSLYAWGANSYGQLGLGIKSEQQVEPKKVNLEAVGITADSIVAIAGGGGHTLLLDELGHVYCCGWNNKGQLGRSDDCLEFRQVEILKGFKVVQISCGWDFSSAVTDCGKLFVWGNNNYTQLGLSRSITCTGIPSLLQVSQKLATGFEKVSSGLRHSAMITKDHHLLVAGAGNKGQLGLGDNYSDDSYLSISKMANLEELKSVACGENHTVALTGDGTVYAWGENKFGQLGLDPALPSSFVPAEILRREDLVELHSGWSHSGALTANGQALLWGRNNYGQLGSDRPEPHVPELNPLLSNIRQLSLGSEHSLAVTKDDELLAWGWNEHGNCGTGDVQNVPRPKRVLADRKVRFAFAGTSQSFAVVLD